MNNSSTLLRTLSTAILLPLLAVEAATASAAPAPDQIVRIAAGEVIHELSTRRHDYERNPHKFTDLVEARLAPLFDFESISDMALGRYGKDATAEQRERFRAAFGKTLMRSYSTAMRSYRDERIDWQPARISADGSEAIVGFVLRRNDGSPPVPVTFRMHARNGQWMVYDVAIENIGLVSTYRNSFSQELKRNGIDGLIARLESKLGNQTASSTDHGR